MAVVDESVAIAMQNIDISGYGSRVALCLPGTTDCAARRFYFQTTPTINCSGYSSAKRTATVLHLAPLEVAFVMASASEAIHGSPSPERGSIASALHSSQ